MPASPLAEYPGLGRSVMEILCVPVGTAFYLLSVVGRAPHRDRRPTGLQRPDQRIGAKRADEPEHRQARHQKLAMIIVRFMDISGLCGC